MHFYFPFPFLFSFLIFFCHALALALAQTISAFGHVEIDWISNAGSRGKVVTPLIKRTVPRTKEFKLELCDLPKRIELEVPFSAKCIITNCSSQRLTAKLCAVIEKQTGIIINGAHGKTLSLGPGETISVNLSFFPLSPGVQSIDGLRLIEQQYDKKYDFDKIVDVFVHAISLNKENKL